MQGVTTRRTGVVHENRLSTLVILTASRGHLTGGWMSCTKPLHDMCLATIMSQMDECQFQVLYLSHMLGETAPVQRCTSVFI